MTLLRTVRGIVMAAVVVIPTHFPHVAIAQSIGDQ